MRQIALALFLLSATASLFARDVHVSNRGSDANVDTREMPLASIDKALSTLCAGEPGTIWLAEGEYHVADGIVLGAGNGGTAQRPLAIRSEVPHQARISGAKNVTDFRPITPTEAVSLISAEAKKHVQVADLHAQGFPALDRLPDQFRAAGCEELIFGDRPMQSARWPNEGFTSFTQVIDAGASAPVHWVTREVSGPGSFRFPSDRAKHWDLSRGVYLHGFFCYDWYDEALKVADYNAETGELRFAAKAAYGIGNPWNKESEREFYAIHVFEELDRAGEYYLDRAVNKLYFWPPGDVNKTPVFVSLCRYPRVARVLDEQPLQPLGNVMRDNIFIACEKPWALCGDVKEQWLTRENNAEWQADDFPFLPATADSDQLDLTRLAEIWKNVPGFEPIPVEKIGLAGMKEN